MSIYDLGRNVKRRIRENQKKKAGRYLSPVRRIECVAPPSSGLFVAMTFDDGPTTMPTNPQRSEKRLTEGILDTLAKFGAKGTFDVIGSTEENYPDTAGPVGTFTWGGVVYDHYPDFAKDGMAGAKNQPALVKRILDEGHEITSHSYRHLLFGRNRLIYGKRKFHADVHSVIGDLKRLESLMNTEYGYRMRLSRPPHYIDKTCDSHDAYDAYRYMNYQYMAASFDGGGWQVSGDYEKDVAAMTAPMKRLLAKNPAALNGQIIFQKDGCNMAKETPIADALEPQLNLLTDVGYKVITVSELLSMSPFEDTPDNDPAFESARALLQAGYCVAHKNNTLQPDKELSLGELLMMTAAPAELLSAYRNYVDSGFSLTENEKAISSAWRISHGHPYFHALVLAARAGLARADNPDKYLLAMPVTADMLGKLCGGLAKDISIHLSAKGNLHKRDVLPVLAELLLK